MAGLFMQSFYSLNFSNEIDFD